MKLVWEYLEMGIGDYFNLLNKSSSHVLCAVCCLSFGEKIYKGWMQEKKWLE